MYKINNNLAPTFMREIFPQKNLMNMQCVASNIRNHVGFYNSSNPKSSNWGLETLRHLGPILLDSVPNDIKEIPSLNGFKAPKLPLQIMQSLYYNHVGCYNLAYT